MGKIGGYQILDLKGTELEAGTGSVIAGATDAVKYAFGKRIVISGLNVGGTAYGDMSAYITSAAEPYTVENDKYTVTIDAADTVTVTPLAEG